MKSLAIFAFLVVFWIAQIYGFPRVFPGQVDQVTSPLPGVNFTIPFKHYSGYLLSVNGTKVHYWFFESQTAQPELDPVVVWLNGGPGCSSLYGELSELGPLHVNQDLSLNLNLYAWNRKFNLLFLESPTGVGFSYREGQTDLSANDAQTAELNFGALKSFFEKFPHLLENQFLLAGESYAGFYIPTLTMLVMDSKFPKNFTGVAIGDGLLDWDLSPNRSKAEFMKSFHLTDEFNPALGKWLNQAEVKKALHIDPNWLGNWEICNMEVTVHYDKFANHDMKSQIKRIVDGGIRTVFYNGDVDPLISLNGTKKFIDQLGYRNLTDLRPWSIDGQHEVGLIEWYEKNLNFVTYFGAGHMVPEDAPAASLRMIEDFVFYPNENRTKFLENF